MKLRGTAQIKKLFFDRKAVMDATTRNESRVMSRQGAFLRRALRNAIRTRNRISQPGEYPTQHGESRTASLKNILFSYNPSTHSVIVGPVRLNTRINVPHLLQHGGTYRKKNGKPVRVRKRKLTKEMYIEKQDRLNSFWKDEIK